MKLKNPFKRTIYPAAKYETTFAFTAEGVDYFQFSDFTNIPALRGLKTMVFYEEFRMKCTLEYLQLHVKAVDNILTKQKIDIYAIKGLNDQLKQRLDIALDTELLYKIASIVFFDRKENIEDYDYNYNAKKIERFKKMPGFFLQQSLTTLLPHLKGSDLNLQAYSTVVSSLNKVHLENLSKNLPEPKTGK